MKTCTIDWCGKKHEAKWYCYKHYARLRRHWNTLDKTIREHCIIDSCLWKSAQRWYCPKHYQKYRKYWDPLFIFYSEKICSIDWCWWKHKSFWYCLKHYGRFKKRWDPNFTSIIHRWNTNNKLYHTRQNMKARCYNTNNWAYNRYWWRWITVCERRLWIDWFTNFCEDMGERPEWMTIDRIDNNWNYEPSNCKRSNIHEQCSNRESSNKCVWVYLNKRGNLWIARIDVNKKSFYLWSYKHYEEAVVSRKNAEIKYNIYK